MIDVTAGRARWRYSVETPVPHVVSRSEPVDPDESRDARSAAKGSKRNGPR
jgi:hypothetical protein